MPDFPLVVGTFVVIVLLGWLAVGWSVLREELRRAFVRWENTWNHPEEHPWPNEPNSRWGPRLPWFYILADWLTGGRCHD